MWHADEIEWMWDLFPGKYAKCRVFALLYGLTKNANGWKGSNARLAKVTRMSTEGVRKILDELAAEQLIAQNGEHIRTTYEPDNSVAESSNSVAPMINSVATDDNPVADTDNSVASLPPTPPNTIKQMEQEKTFAPTVNCDVPETAIPSFEAFLSAFAKRGGSYTEWQKLHRMAEELRGTDMELDERHREEKSHHGRTRQTGWFLETASGLVLAGLYHAHTSPSEGLQSHLRVPDQDQRSTARECQVQQFQRHLHAGGCAEASFGCELRDELRLGGLSADGEDCT